MSAQDKLMKAGLPELLEAADASSGLVDTYGGSTGEMGGSLRANVPVPGMNKVAPATFAVFSVGTATGPGGLTRGKIQAQRIGSRYGCGVTAPVWLARV
mmetsp:Transcript_55383/g.148335  ORF Transcript_55383/g.148335 Transcript_55383/m.148335 type:complete len:99 (-) Transcript_55383:36-332(-)